MASHIPMDLDSNLAPENRPELVLFSKPGLQTAHEGDQMKSRNALGDIGNRARKLEGNKVSGLKDPNMKPSSYQFGALRAQIEAKASSKGVQENKQPFSKSSSALSVSNREAHGKITRATTEVNTNLLLMSSQDSATQSIREGGDFRKPDIIKANRRGIRKHAVQQEPVASAESTAIELQVESVVSAFSEQRLNELPEDIDAKDGANYILVSEYIAEIMDYMFGLEKKFPIEAKFLDGRSINSRMRAVLMDWLVEVHNQYNFSAETLYLCNKIMDRFLSIEKQISRGDLQLVGVTALFLASKYEEVYVPSIRDFAVISDNAFTVGHIRSMESRILQALGFDLSCPQPCFFLRRFSKAAHADVKLHSLAKYIMELSVIDYTVVELMPSAIAAASLAIALMILNSSSSLATLWNRTLEHYSSYTVASLRPIARKMANVLARAHEDQSKLKAVKQKYAKGKTFFRISRLEELNLENWKERIFSELQD